MAILQPLVPLIFLLRLLWTFLHLIPSYQILLRHLTISANLSLSSSIYLFLQCFDTVGWVIWPIKTRPRYDLQCVWWDIKPYSINQSIYLYCHKMLEHDPTIIIFTFYMDKYLSLPFLITTLTGPTGTPIGKLTNETKSQTVINIPCLVYLCLWGAACISRQRMVQTYTQRTSQLKPPEYVQ